MAGNDCRDRWSDPVRDCDTKLTKCYTTEMKIMNGDFTMIQDR
jgi:hypothetical protein